MRRGSASEAASAGAAGAAMLPGATEAPDWDADADADAGGVWARAVVPDALNAMNTAMATGCRVGAHGRGSVERRWRRKDMDVDGNGTPARYTRGARGGGIRVAWRQRARHGRSAGPARTGPAAASRPRSRRWLAVRMAASWTGLAGSRSASVAEGAGGGWGRVLRPGRERGGVYRVCFASLRNAASPWGDRRPAVAPQEAACAPGRPASTTKRAAVDTGLFASHGDATLRSSTSSRSARSSKRM